MSVTILGAIVVVIALLGIAVIVLLARRQGPESTLMVRTDDEIQERRVDEELSDSVNTGVDVDGHLSGPAIPEPAGPPPVEGAQWDEVHGRWVHWDPATNAWVPVSS